MYYRISSSNTACLPRLSERADMELKNQTCGQGLVWVRRREKALSRSPLQVSRPFSWQLYWNMHQNAHSDEALTASRPHPHQVPSLEPDGVRAHLELSSSFLKGPLIFLSESWVLPQVRKVKNPVAHKPYLRSMSSLEGKRGLVDRIRAWLSLSSWLPWCVSDLLSRNFRFTSQEHL